jgi:hypothetical protein
MDCITTTVTQRPRISLCSKKYAFGHLGGRLCLWSSRRYSRSNTNSASYRSRNSAATFFCHPVQRCDRSASCVFATNRVKLVRIKNVCSKLGFAKTFTPKLKHCSNGRSRARVLPPERVSSVVLAHVKWAVLFGTQRRRPSGDSTQADGARARLGTRVESEPVESLSHCCQPIASWVMLEASYFSIPRL